jgi:hypothetical protein
LGIVSNEIKDDTKQLRKDTEQILDEIDKLRSLVSHQLPGHAQGRIDIMEKYLDSLTTYAETAIDTLSVVSAGSPPPWFEENTPPGTSPPEEMEVEVEATEATAAEVEVKAPQTADSTTSPALAFEPSFSLEYRPIDKIGFEFAAWHQLNKPLRTRHFGDGHEPDGFDDPPTSSQAEAQYLKQPDGAGPPKAQMRSRMYQNVLPDRTMTPSPIYSPRVNNVPRFARDTAASRIARETILAQRISPGSLTPPTTQRVAQLSASSYSYNSQPTQQTTKSRKPRRTPQLKPHLIANLNPPKDSTGKSNLTLPNIPITTKIPIPSKTPTPLKITIPSKGLVASKTSVREKTLALQVTIPSNITASSKTPTLLRVF